ncbi:MAG TPA: cupin domain-containing protein [Bryobacteraceae bacterium]|nr:cupin domain-containing protein [Bryobacteraceae bacterium]
MTDKQSVPANRAAPIPADDVRRFVTVAGTADTQPVHIGVSGDTYTILLTGVHTAGRFCLIDMHVPPGGGPPPHRHNFEETFTVLEGELEATCRGDKVVVRAGETVNIPANAPHQFRNSSAQPVRMLCICAPAGLEEFFLEIGVPVPTRTAPPPELDAVARAAFKKKAEALAPKYATEFLQNA